VGVGAASVAVRQAGGRRGEAADLEQADAERQGGERARGPVGAKHARDVDPRCPVRVDPNGVIEPDERPERVVDAD
jgi:hypothetical protein